MVSPVKLTSTTSAGGGGGGAAHAAVAASAEVSMSSAVRMTFMIDSPASQAASRKLHKVCPTNRCSDR